MSVSDDRKRMPAVPEQFKPDGGPLTGAFKRSVDDPVGAVNERAAERQREELLKAQGGPDALAGGNSAMADRVRTLLGLDEAENRKDEDTKLQMQLVAVNEYLERVRERIAVLDELAAELRQEAVEHTERFDELSDLYQRMDKLELDEHTDPESISPEQRAKMLDQVREARRKMGIKDDVSDGISNAELLTIWMQSKHNVNMTAAEQLALAEAKRKAAQEAEDLARELEEVADDPEMSAEEKEARIENAFEQASNVNVIKNGSDLVDDPQVKAEVEEKFDDTFGESAEFSASQVNTSVPGLEP